MKYNINTFNNINLTFLKKFYEGTLTGEVTIPEGTRTIGNFRESDKVTSIILNDDLEEIRGYAFYGCKSLVSITLKNRITSISYNVFYNTSLTELIFRGTIEEFENIEKASKWRNGSNIIKIICEDGVISYE